MAKFLDAQNTVKSIIDVIKQSAKEIIIIVPYVKMSPIIHEEIKKTIKKNTQIILVYRENEMHFSEKNKLFSLKNLTILHHPTVHCKCYLNESEAVITSMNLYAPTEKRNREMGILLQKEDDYEALFEMMKEVRSIISASSLERKSDYVQQSGFNFELLKSKRQRLEPFVKIIESIFSNKKFEIIKTDDEYASPIIQCSPYHDKLVLQLDYEYYESEAELGALHISLKRFKIDFQKSDDILEKFHRAFKKAFEFESSQFPDYHIYWNNFYGSLTIYPGRERHPYPKWIDYPFEKQLLILKEDLDFIIRLIKKVEKDTKLY